MKFATIAMLFVATQALTLEKATIKAPAEENKDEKEEDEELMKDLDKLIEKEMEDGKLAELSADEEGWKRRFKRVWRRVKPHVIRHAKKAFCR